MSIQVGDIVVWRHEWSEGPCLGSHRGRVTDLLPYGTVEMVDEIDGKHYKPSTSELKVIEGSLWGDVG
jgi:hypothetical protein